MGMGMVGILLHEEHESDTRHESPVQLGDKLLVQSSHLLLTQVSKCFETRLDLLGRNDTILGSNFLEFGISHFLFDDLVYHLEADESRKESRRGRLECSKPIVLPSWAARSMVI
jgi:hypothetical protein